MKDNPSFTIFTGPMMGGKTSRLLATLDRFKYQHKSVVVFKPVIDDRYSHDEIVSHSGWKHSAVCVKEGSDILGYLADLDEPPAVIAVDEAFMIPNVAETLIWLFRSGFSIVVSTLDISASGKPFHEVEKMLPWSTHIEKCCAVCVICGKDAFYTHKKQVGGDEIEIGGGELYEPRCFSHSVSVNKSTLKE